MSAATAQSQFSPSQQKGKEKTPDFISWEDFEKEYLSLEDGYRYEWLNGTIEKTPAMNRTQLYILYNLQEYFMRLKYEDKVTGQLLAESDLFFKNKHRRPDICWLTQQQVINLSEKKTETPTFAIEVISDSDVLVRVVKKMQDYRAAGVKTVWHIFPEQKEVHIYSGANLDKMLVRRGNKICSAAPGLPEFKIPVGEIFKK